MQLMCVMYKKKIKSTAFIYIQLQTDPTPQKIRPVNWVYQTLNRGPNFVYEDGPHKKSAHLRPV
jgi:hypothetical protein